jgi:putative sigma-54 modulation protein
MQITVTFRHIEATEALRRHAEKRVRHVAKYVHQLLDAHVILSVVKRRHIAEMVLTADRATLKATEETDDLYSAIDLATEKLAQQARRHTGKLKSHKVAVPRRGSRKVPAGRKAESAVPEPVQVRGSLRMDVLRADTFARRNGPEIIRSKSLPVKPMSIEEAVMQMDLMSSDFLVFRNAANQGVAVVYRRKDGHYGLIEPEAP